MILLNMGSKYVLADLGKAHERILNSEIFKKIILFSMFFVATRDVITSLLLTFLYVIIVDGIFHENRNYAVITLQNDVVQTESDQDAYKRYLQNVNLLRLQ